MNVRICIWHESPECARCDDPHCPYIHTGGWYWDTAEDSGGFDRISPMGPCASREEACNDAALTFGTVTVEDGKPSYY